MVKPCFEPPSLALIEGRLIQVAGVVQGVGFRPFVYRLARAYDLVGWVRNTGGGVEIQLSGTSPNLAAFVAALPHELPPLARLDSFQVSPCPALNASSFEILPSHSADSDQAGQAIPPDIALCENCRRELFDPADRRYHYPFINCTDCGPRFSIVQALPYDRPLTTMAAFELCPTCAAEYDSPSNRRFHAQPIACPTCGPYIWLEVGGATLSTHEAALEATRALLRAGKIVAIKGLGGFHLACDATNPAAVAELRRRKNRPYKAFALMLADLAEIENYCQVSPHEAARLTSAASPIVLLKARDLGLDLLPHVAPQQKTLGLMLPYTPLHALLLAPDHLGAMPPLIMTSGNRGGEAILSDNDAAREALALLVDAFLMHNRPIHIAVDDSVLRVVDGGDLPIRRARGYAPAPLILPHDAPPLLAVGAELKNTFCLAEGQNAFLSQHIGDLENESNLRAFEGSIRHFERLFKIQPRFIAHDLHPDYAATRYAHARAEAENLPLVGVQHHHAHIAACMAENGLSGDHPILGVCLDGSGYGADGTIWGGEFLLADYANYERLAHLKTFPLVGGDAAVRKPARLALGYLLSENLPLDPRLPIFEVLSETEQRIIAQQLTKNLNTFQTSSMGRLFDLAAALIGICGEVTYEGQAAIALEACADPAEQGRYNFGLGAQVDSRPLIQALLSDVLAGIGHATLAARFQNAVAHMLSATCSELARQTGLKQVALSGGVFQNVTLLNKTIKLLSAEGFTLYHHQRVPPNDGGLALGQAAIAAQILR